MNIALMVRVAIAAAAPLAIVALTSVGGVSPEAHPAAAEAAALPFGERAPAAEAPLAVGPSVPSLWVTPLFLDFGPVGVGFASAVQTVTITNTGTVTLTNFAGGAPFDTQFSASQNCAGGVAPGASCRYTFTFKPTSAGTFTTTSNTSTNAGPFVITLRGTGVGPRLHVTPLSLDFGPVAVGSTSPNQVVTIRNTGVSTLTNFAGGAPFDPQFGAFQNCAGGVAPGASCQYTFNFKPTSAGAVTTTSNTSTNAGPFVITLTGRGVTAPPSGNDKWVTPLFLDFGPVGVGFASAVQTVTITNTGTVPLTDFAGGAPFDTQFSASQNCASGVPPGGSCRYTFTFKPTSAGTFTTTSNTSTNAGPFVITLRGTGVGASFNATPLSLDFGYVPVGVTSPPQRVTIVNTSPTTLTNFAGGAPFDPQFDASQNCASGVPPGGSCQYTFTFTPSSLGRKTTTSSSSTNGGPIVIELAGGVAAPTLSMQFLPANVEVDAPSTLRYLITNTNPAQAVTGVALNNSLPAGVQVASPNGLAASPECNGPTLSAPPGGSAVSIAGAVIVGGKTCVVTVTVRATTAGAFVNAAMASSTEGGTGNAATATLVATIQPPAFAMAFEPASIEVGAAATLRAHITNTNAVASLTGVGLTITLPSGLQVGSPSGLAASGACGTPTLSAAPGGTTISMAGASVEAGATCEVTVQVRATAGGSFVVSTTATSANAGSSAPATATLVATIQPPAFAMAFEPASIEVGAAATLRAHITNTNAVAPLTGVGLTITLPSGLQVGSPSGLAASGACGTPTLSAAPGGTTISMAGASVAAGATCEVTVQVRATAGGSFVVSTTATSANAGPSAPAAATLSATSRMYVPFVVK